MRERELEARLEVREQEVAEREAATASATQVLESEHDRVARKKEQLAALEAGLIERARELGEKEDEVERRAATLEVDVELREEKVERREHEVTEHEERLVRKEAEVAAYVADAQVALRRRESALRSA